MTIMASILYFVQISCTFVPDPFLSSWIPPDQEMHQTKCLLTNIITITIIIILIKDGTLWT